MLGCISGPLFDAGYLRSLVATGGVIYVFCFMMASIAKEYYQFLLAHGFGVGIGMGIMFSPSVSTLSHHFARSRYRTLAYGCQASGSAVAGIIFPIMLRFLFPTVGFGWAMRISE
jgi:MFS family permease